MLTLKVENFDRLGDGGPLSFEADRRGFDFGRDQHLDWTLPDPTRKVSGKHCTVLYEKGGYYLYDVSTNGTYVNGSSRRVQSPYELKHGDELEAGDYIISVSIAGAARPAAPLQPQPAPPPDQPPHQPVSPDVWAGESGSLPPLRREDLMPPQTQPTRGGDFLSAAVTPLPDVPHEPQAAIPANDPWGPPTAPPRPQAPPPPPPDGQDVWPSPAPSPPPPARMPSDMSVSDVLREVPFPAPRAPAAVPPRRPAEERSRPAPPVAASPPDTPGDRINQEVLRRFAEGANIPSNLLGNRNAGDLAYEMGEIFRVVCANLMQLLKARAEMKSVVRTSARTMIETRENNALKFTPSAEAALAIMFGQPAAGYLDPKSTVEKSFDDLKLHEAATFSAMQQALIQLMDDLSPDSIEQAAGTGKLGFLGGKTKQWELFTERWKAKAGNSEHGLLDAFLDEFASYYDAAIPRRRQ